MPEIIQLPKLIAEDLNFEKAGPAHAAVLAALHKKSFEKPWTAAEFEKLLSQSGTSGLVALEADLAPLGFILARSSGEEAEILTLGVVPQYRSQKIATGLLKSMMKGSKSLGVDRFNLEVAEDNLPAIGLYQACGFKNVGKRPGYYHQRGETAKDAIVMAYSYRKF